jgi:RNA polymerase sigma-70 factor (sigma-E family)
VVAVRKVTEVADGFDALFARERRPMVRLAFLLVGSEAVAEEVVQDAFARVFERWGRLDRPGAYLRQCVVNGARSQLRRRRLEHRVPPAPPSDVPADDSADLLAVLAVLTPKRRAAVVLRYYEQLSQEEVAQVLGIRVGTVKSMLHRALADLREVVER